MVFSQLAQRMVSPAAAVTLVIGMVTVGIVAAAPSASAAGTVLFNQPFHDNTVDGPAGSVSLPTAAAGGGNFACLTATGNENKTGPLFSCSAPTDSAGLGQAPLHPGFDGSGGRRIRQHQRPHLPGPGRDLQLLPVRGHRGGRDGVRAGRRQPGQPGHPLGHRAVRRRPRLFRPELQHQRPELRLPGRRLRRVRQLQRQVRGLGLHRPGQHRAAHARPGRRARPG